MFYDEDKTMLACKDEPSLIFELIREDHFEFVDKLLTKKKVDINTLSPYEAMSFLFDIKKRIK